MTAIDTSKPGAKDPTKPDGEHRPVSGTATIYGVYSSTRTYVFGLTHSPTNKQ